MTEPDRVKGKKVSVATIALGRIWRNIRLASPTPSARAARTESRFRPRKNSARTTPVSPIQENSSKNPSKVQKLGWMMLARMISKNSCGMPDQISMKRWNNKSVSPP